MQVVQGELFLQGIYKLILRTTNTLIKQARLLTLKRQAVFTNY